VDDAMTSPPTEPGQPEEPEAPQDPEAEAARERAVFDELVAAFHSESAPDPVPRWPVVEDAAEAPAGSRPERPPVNLDVHWDQPIVEPTDETTIDRYFPNEHFEPPDPPPLPEVSGATKASWTLLAGGVLFMLASTLLNWDTPRWAFWVALASAFGGIVSLVARMRPDRDEYDDPDNGAVV
jgi:hypothetical protein